MYHLKCSSYDYALMKHGQSSIKKHELDVNLLLLFLHLQQGLLDSNL